MNKGTIVNKKWEVNDLIGKGNFGEVYALKSQKNIPYEICIKTAKIPKNPKKDVDQKRACDLIYYEYNIINTRLLDFPYKPKNPDKFYGEDKECRYIVMQRLTYNLKEYFEKTSNDRNILIMQYGNDILKGLEWLHSKGILCLDIKPENFMVDDNGKLFFVDYGLMVLNTPGFRSRETPVGVEGTPMYVSLDVQKGKIPSPKDDIESMIYMLIFLRKMKLPWRKGKTLEEIFSKKEKYTSNGKLKKFCVKKDIENLWNILEFCWSSEKKVDYKLINDFLNV